MTAAVELQREPVITRLVLLGATGDLAGRFLLPALARLVAAGRVPLDLQVVGGGHQDWTDRQFRDHVESRLREHAGELPDDARGGFSWPGCDTARSTWTTRTA